MREKNIKASSAELLAREFIVISQLSAMRVLKEHFGFTEEQIQKFSDEHVAEMDRYFQKMMR